MRDFLELTKPRITMLILVFPAVGYFFGSNSFHLGLFAHVLRGTALMASGTAALNQWYEADSDAKMRRTNKRPIPAGRIEPVYALAFGAWLSIAGFGELWFQTKPHCMSGCSCSPRTSRKTSGQRSVRSMGTPSF